MIDLQGYKLTADHVTLDGVHVYCAGQVGISGSKAGGYIDGFTFKKSIISGKQDTPGDNAENEKWGARLFNLRDALFEDSEFRNIEEEHDLYLGRAGNTRIQRCFFHDTGGQGIQDAQREIDSIEGRLANVQCLLEILQCRFERCATPFGGGRQSWNLTVFGWDDNLRTYYPDGPLILTPLGQPQKGHFVRSLTDVIVAGCDFHGDGYPHLASGNRDCDSTGAILIGDRFNADILRCTMNFVRPDREIIQIKNVENASIRGCEVNGGDIVLVDMDNCHVNITACKGAGDIRRRVLGAHTSTFLSKITAGYSH